MVTAICNLGDVGRHKNGRKFKSNNQSECFSLSKLIFVTVFMNQTWRSGQLSGAPNCSFQEISVRKAYN